MSELPKLNIKSPFPHAQGTFDLEQAKDILFRYGDRTIVTVEGQRVYSYDELVQLAAQDCYKDKEFLEAMVLPSLAAGG